MDLILWRHAEAEPGTADLPDEARRLTPKGIKQAIKMARWLDSNLTESCRILVSPTLRTRETMAALDRKFKIVHELAPDASVEQVLAAANWPNSREQVLIVGHQPYLGQVAARLIAPMQDECAVRKGNVWWISQKQKETEGLHTFLKAIMTPELVVK
jgi:phosphohistidine phosphatase